MRFVSALAIGRSQSQAKTTIQNCAKRGPTSLENRHNVHGVGTVVCPFKPHAKLERDQVLLSDDTDTGARNETADAIEMSEELFRLVAPTELVVYPGGDLKILLIDVGAKDNIARALLARGATVIRVPWFDDLARHASEADGIVIGNGPGNPKDLADLIGQLRQIMESFEKPVFGICLGHQILALAAGADTYKLPYGRRTVNQPVEDLLTRRCYITSQNHGYAVHDESLPANWEPRFVNINDGTNEGIRSRLKPFFSVQFHPESHTGPRDTEFLFDQYLRLVAAAGG